MPMIPVRDLAKGGIILDQHPTSLPLPAFTGGRNVMFDDGKAYRSPVWRRAAANLNTTSPARFIITRTPASGFDEIIIARDDASLARWSSSSLADASEAGFTPTTTPFGTWTGCFLGDVLYVNRPDIAPRALLPNSTQFVSLAHWDATWRCRVLRGFKDSLVALGITKGTTEGPSTVKVSDLAFYQTVPGSWDATDPTKLAYETPLARLTGPILDGRTLGDRFLIYTADQVVEMTMSGNFIYAFQDLPFRDGVMATNCVTEVDGLHYVFGTRDFYVTDGQTKKSLAENRIKDTIFRRIDMSKRDRCFIQFFPVTNSVLFAYVSGADDTAWRAPTGCNEGIFYNRSSDTWSAPIDLPNVHSMTVSDVDTTLTWDSVGTLGFPWSGMGGSWYDQEDSRNRNLIALSLPLSTQGSRSVIPGNGMLIGYDFANRGRLSLPIDTACTATSYVEKVGIGLDVVQGGSAPLVAGKLIRGVYPEISVADPDAVVQVSLAGTQIPLVPADWPTTPTTFRPAHDYAVDAMADGRFLATRWVFPDNVDTEMSGFDLDVVPNGRR